MYLDGRQPTKIVQVIKRQGRKGGVERDKKTGKAANRISTPVFHSSFSSTGAWPSMRLQTYRYAPIHTLGHRVAF